MKKFESYCSIKSLTLTYLMATLEHGETTVLLQRSWTTKLHTEKERETEISIKVRVNPFIYSHSFGRSPPYINNVRYYCRKL